MLTGSGFAPPVSIDTPTLDEMYYNDGHRAAPTGWRISFKARSHNRSGLRSPVFASSMILFAIACLMSSSQSPIRKATLTCVNATPRMRIVS